MSGPDIPEKTRAPNDDVTIIRCRQVCATAVTAAMVLVCLLGMTQHPRVAPRPITKDDAMIRRVAIGVNVNTAEWPALAQLPGIGQGLARRIITYRAAQREASGKEWVFLTAGDMQSVPGIGPKTVRRIAPFVRPAKAKEEPRQRPATE